MNVCVLDEFILDAVVNTNDIVSDADAATHARPFGESSYSAVISKGATIGVHNAYVAVGTFASAIFIVAIVVSIFNAAIYFPFNFYRNQFQICDCKNKASNVPCYKIDIYMLCCANKSIKNRFAIVSHWSSGLFN